MKSIKDILVESGQSERFKRAGRGSGNKLSKAEEKKIAMTDSNLFFKYKLDDWSFEATIHAAAQEYERRPDMTEEDWKDFHSRVYDKIKTMKPLGGEFIFFSKKYQQAYVAAVDFNNATVRVITVLPKGRSNPKPGTIRMIIEGKQYELQTVMID